MEQGNSYLNHTSSEDSVNSICKQYTEATRSSGSDGDSLRSVSQVLTSQARQPGRSATRTADDMKSSCLRAEPSYNVCRTCSVVAAVLPTSIHYMTLWWTARSTKTAPQTQFISPNMLLSRLLCGAMGEQVKTACPLTIRELECDIEITGAKQHIERTI